MRWFESFRSQHEALENAREEHEHIIGYDDQRPRLNFYGHWLVEQFRQLSSQRPSAFGEVPAAIPISEMRAHWEWLELGDVCPPAEFEHYMILMDRELRIFRAGEADKNREEEPE